MKDCGHNSVVIKPLVPDDAGACLTPIEAIRYHAVCVDPIHRGGTLLIAGRYLKGARAAALDPANKAYKGTYLRFQITGYVENVGSLVWNDFSLFSCSAASQTKRARRLIR
jgi:hypothetical protein